jgi:mannose-1-phosphate guanylyltransferase
MGETYALIMAGGAGTRLWPLSRKTRPKPLIPLVEKERSMFQIAVDRLLPIFPPERILVVANTFLTPQLQAQAPAVPAENFITEPTGRDTAPAIGLGAIHVQQRDPDAVMAVLTADHYIANETAFRRVLVTAVGQAQEGAVVTLGIIPTHASTGFGYIERGEMARTVDGVEVFALRQFHEKPDQDTATQYLGAGNYCWNSGMFIWPVRRVLDAYEQFAPDIHAILMQISQAAGRPEFGEMLALAWPEMRKVSVDYALLEHITQDIYVIPVEMGWYDIGNFGALYDILAGKEGDNASVSAKDPLYVDTEGTLIVSRRLVAMIGVEDLVIIDTDDALLVCRRDRTQDVKMLVELLQKGNRDSYL